MHYKCVRQSHSWVIRPNKGQSQECRRASNWDAGPLNFQCNMIFLVTGSPAFQIHAGNMVLTRPWPYGLRMTNRTDCWLASDKPYGDKLYGVPWLGVDKLYGLISLGQTVRMTNRTDCFFALISLGQTVRRTNRTDCISWCCWCCC